MSSLISPSYQSLAGCATAAVCLGSSIYLTGKLKFNQASQLTLKKPSVISTTTPTESVKNRNHLAKQYSGFAISSSCFSKEIDEKISQWVFKYYDYITNKFGWEHPAYKITSTFSSYKIKLLRKFDQQYSSFETRLANYLLSIPKKDKVEISEPKVSILKKCREKIRTISLKISRCYLNVIIAYENWNQSKKYVVKSLLTAGFFIVFNFNPLPCLFAAGVLFSFDIIIPSITPLFLNKLQSELITLSSLKSSLKETFEKKINEVNFDDGTCYGKSLAIIKYIMKFSNVTFKDVKLQLHDLKNEVLYFQLYQQIQNSIESLAEMFITSIGKKTKGNFNLKKHLDSLKDPLKLEKARKIQAIAQNVIHKGLLKHFPKNTLLTAFDIDGSEEATRQKTKTILLRPIENHSGKICFEISAKIANSEGEKNRKLHSLLVYIDEKNGIFDLNDSFSRYTEWMHFPNKDLLIEGLLGLCAVRYPEIYHIDRYHQVTITNTNNTKKQDEFEKKANPL